MMGRSKFSDADRLQELREERCDRRDQKSDVNNNKIKELDVDLNGTNPHITIRAKNTDAWMNLWGTWTFWTLECYHNLRFSLVFDLWYQICNNSCKYIF